MKLYLYLQSGVGGGGVFLAMPTESCGVVLTQKLEGSGRGAKICHALEGVAPDLNNTVLKGAHKKVSDSKFPHFVPPTFP